MTAPMWRPEFLACLKAIDRTQSWFLRRAGAHKSATDAWFKKEGGPPPGVPDDLAAWLRQEEKGIAALRLANPMPKPAVWRRDTRGDNPRLARRRAE
jgi:hypothetical protein